MISKKLLLAILWSAIPIAFIAAYFANTLIAGTFTLFLASHFVYLYQAQRFPKDP